ncbi:hypothetical protein ACFXKG_38790 [Streptomyces sp. NPDC059255]|uniref:hypothetical protein n=1 Tax=Streptomyces sp. NPDC059255 TaxID=3346793 RepID=UPI00369CAF2C
MSNFGAIAEASGFNEPLMKLNMANPGKFRFPWISHTKHGRGINMRHITWTVWGVIMATAGFTIAFDYRNIGLRFYDFMAAHTPDGSIDPRFTPDICRIIWGIMGTIGLCVAAFNIFQKFIR